MQSSSSADEGSEQGTGILMVTLPESSDDFHTPPEHQLGSQNSGNNSQVPATKTVALDQEVEIDGTEDRQTMVVDDTYERKRKRMVDITKDSDNLEFVEKSPTNLENNNTVLEDSDTKPVDLNDTEPIEEDYRVEETNAENRVEETPKMLTEDAPKVFVEMPIGEEVVSMSTTEVNTSLKKSDHHNDFHHVDPNGKRKTEKKHEVFIDILNRACKLLKEEVKAGADGDEDDGDCDFLETAMQRGLTFPRPRWWPPEGGSQD